MTLYSPNHPAHRMFDVPGLPSGNAIHGRFASFYFVQEGSNFIAYWSVDKLGARSTYSVYVYRSGVFIREVSNLEGDYIILPPTNRARRTAFDFILGPKGHPYWRNMPLAFHDIQNRVRMTYTLTNSDKIAKVKILQSDPNGASVNTVPVKVFAKPVATTSETGVTIGGGWHGSDRTGTLAFTNTASGEVGDATFSWAFGTASGTITAQSYYQHIINGLSIKFNDGITYSSNFDVSIDLPSEWTTRPLERTGTYKFRVDTINAAGNTTDGTVDSIAVTNFPEEPTITEQSPYVDGSGEIDLTITAPSDSDVSEIHVFKNRLDVSESIHWLPIHIESVAPDGSFNLTVTGLKEGRNLIIARSTNTSGKMEENFLPWEIQLDSNLDEITYPSAPYNITATLQSDYTIDVDVVVDDTCDSVNLYASTSLATLYDSVWSTVTNGLTLKSGQKGTLTKEGLTQGVDGRYFIGARCVGGGVEETNDFIIDTIQVVNADADAATSLSLQVVT